MLEYIIHINQGRNISALIVISASEICSFIVLHVLITAKPYLPSLCKHSLYRHICWLISSVLLFIHRTEIKAVQMNYYTKHFSIHSVCNIISVCWYYCLAEMMLQVRYKIKPTHNKGVEMTSLSVALCNADSGGRTV